MAWAVQVEASEMRIVSPGQQGRHDVQAQKDAGNQTDVLPRPLPLSVNLSYLLIALICTVFAVGNYDSFPSRIPTHAGLDGQVNAWVGRSLSPGSLLLPVLFCAIIGISFTLAHVAMIRSGEPLGKNTPAPTAQAYASFTRATSWVMLVGGTVICAVFAFCFYASALDLVPLGLGGTVMAIVAALLLVALLFASRKTGWAQARKSTQATPGKAAHWRAGVFYYNPKDTAVFVPKRFGVGWTNNWAHPSSWLCMAALLALIVLACLMV